MKDEIINKINSILSTKYTNITVKILPIDYTSGNIHPNISVSFNDSVTIFTDVSLETFSNTCNKYKDREDSYNCIYKESGLSDEIDRLVYIV